jgi:hypothetical protein
MKIMTLPFSSTLRIYAVKKAYLVTQHQSDTAVFEKLLSENRSAFTDET